MDTGSHLLLGVTLAGLAAIDPVVATNENVATAVLIGTLIGSNAPDFDSVVRIKGEAAYLRHHRGLTHALPALPLWALLIVLPLSWSFGIMDHITTLLLWVFAAVCLHVGLDLLNAYGVQCFRPFSKRWWHMDVLCLFDPYLFALHTTGAVIWMTGKLPPGPMFGWIYLISLLYIVWRIVKSRKITRMIRKRLGTSGPLTLIPDLSGACWQFTAETVDKYIIGTVRGGIIHEKTELKITKDNTSHPVVRATLNTDGVRAFLHFAERVHVEWKERLDGYEVTWSDVRFWHNQKMPFGVAVTLDRDMNVIQDRLGWNKKTWEPPHV
ncbi:metal-dependent hydrolase [Paenibacillus tarimensis]